MELIISVTIIFQSSIYIRHYKINTRDYCDQIGNQKSLTNKRDLLKVSEGWSPNSGSVGVCSIIAYEVIAVDTFCCLDHYRSFSMRNNWAPTHIKEVVNECFYVLHRAFFWGRRG